MSSQEKSSKLADNDVLESKRVQNTMKGSIARSTFIAGFAYSEIGRNDTVKFVDEAYVWLMTMALGWAIISVGVGTFTIYYLDRSRTMEQKNVFIMAAKPTYVRGCFRAFLLALLCYCLGLSRCGWVYYQDCTWGTWYTFAVGLLLIPMAFIGVFKIMRSEVELRNHSALVKDHNVHGGRAADELHVLMTKEANTIASRAIYVTGFVQSGVTRFITTDNPLGYIYLFIVVLALDCAVVSGFVMSVEAIFLYDTNPEVQPAFAVILRTLHNGLSLSYGLSVIFLCFALMFMGWGCAFPNEAWCTMVFGLLALFTLVLAGFIAIRRMTALNREEALPSKSISPTPTTKDEQSGEIDPFNAAHVKQLLNTTGSQATISSGFVFYNVVTFSSDVLPLNQTSYELKIAFLLVCAATLATGVIASGVDSIITLTLTNLESPKKREAFLRQSSGMVSLCVRTYQVSMVGFLSGFALVGLVKFPRISLISSYYVPIYFIPAVSALGAAVLVGLGWISLRILWSSTNGLQSVNAMCSESVESSTFEDDRVANRMKCQDMVSNRALFFGGFAYFTICLFASGFAQTHRDVADQWYLIPLCCTFTLSVVVIIWSANYSINNELCTSQEHRRRMRESSTTFYYTHLAVSILATVSFPIAFISIESYNTSPYGVLVLRGMCLLFFLLPIAVWKIMKLGTNHTDEEISLLFLSPHLEASPSHGPKLRERFRWASDVLITDPGILDEPERILNQVEATATQSAFIAGNVFYEILFAESAPNGAPWICDVYFVASSVTFISGCAVVGVATAISFVVTKLGMDKVDKKTYIASRVRFVKNLQRLKVKKILFGLSILCIFSWVTALTALGAAKYRVKQTFWEPSFSSGLVAALLLSWSLYRLKSISNQSMDRTMPKDGKEITLSPKKNYGSMETETRS